MARVILIILLLASSAWAQLDTVRIDNFAPGMVNARNPLQLPPGAAKQAVNVDLGKKIGSISVRPGFERVGTIAGQDEIIGISPALYSDNGRRLVFATDSTGVGYGNVYATPRGSSAVDSAVEFGTAFPITQVPTFTTFNDVIFAMNGVSHGRYWDGKSATGKPFPLIPTGGLLVTPLTTAGPVSGKVRYAISFDIAENDTVSNRLSFLSGPFIVDGGQVRVSGFSLRTKDTTFSGPDTVRVKLWRTTGDIGRLDEADTIWFTGITLKIDSSNWQTAYVIDSVSDDSLRNSATYQVILQRNSSGIPDALGNNSGLQWQSSGGSRAPKPVRYKVSPGMIGYVGMDTTVTNDWGIWQDSVWFGPGIDSSYPGFYGWKWAVLLADTLGNVISDTAITFTYVEQWGYDFVGKEYMELVLPRVVDSDLVMKVYRTPIVFNYKHVEMNDEIPLWYEDLANGYWFIGSYGPGDTLKDSIPWDSLSAGSSSELLNLPLTRSFMHHPFAVEDQMFGLFESEVLISKPDTAEFPATQFQSMNKHDGDDNVTMFEARGLVRVAKNGSMFNLYQDADGLWNKQEITQGYGIIASESYARGIAGHYYLGLQGVLREVEGQVLERTQQSSLVSEPLDNFRVMSLATLRGGTAVAWDEKYLLSFPDLDSTFVYDELAGGWVIWDYGFSDACLYGQSVGLPDSLYFILPGDASLYRVAGTSDTGAAITVVWESSPMLSDMNLMQVQEADLWVSGTDSTDSLLQVVLKNESGVSTAGDTAYLPNLKAARVHRVTFPPHAEKLEVSVRLAGELVDTRIDRIQLIRRWADEVKASR